MHFLYLNEIQLTLHYSMDTLLTSLLVKCNFIPFESPFGTKHQKSVSSNSLVLMLSFILQLWVWRREFMPVNYVTKIPL